MNENQNIRLCTCCGEEINTDEEDYSFVGDDILCQTCADDECGVCVHCEELVYNTDAYTDDDHFLCPHCYENHYTRCEDCGRIVRNCDAYYSGDYDFCYDCYEKRHSSIHEYSYKPAPMDMIAKNPSQFITLPKRIKQERRFFTVEEQQKLQSCLKGEKIEMLVLLDLYTGMRQGELLGLMWKDVHLNSNGQSYLRVTQTLNRIKLDPPVNGRSTGLCIGIPKTAQSVRNIPLLPEIADALAAYKQQQEAYFRENGIQDIGYVFTNLRGEWIDPRTFQQDFKRLLKRHGIREVNVHGIRHTFATRALESGMSIKTLSQILGHSSTAFTMDIYGHVTEELKVSEMASLQGFLGKETNDAHDS